jgi:hypothetical protein
MSYVTYPFALSTSGNQLIFTFTLPATAPLTLPLVNPWYVNIPNMTIKIDRFDNNLVSFGDPQGIITVNFTLSTSPSPAGGLTAWLASVVALTVPAPTTAFTANKTSAQTATGVLANVLFNNVETSTTDLTYVPVTGVFTVNTTGDYEVNMNIPMANSTVKVEAGLRVPASGSMVKYVACMAVSGASLAEMPFSCIYHFTAGQTFSIGIISSSNLAISLTETPLCYLAIKRIP